MTFLGAALRRPKTELEGDDGFRSDAKATEIRPGPQENLAQCREKNIFGGIFGGMFGASCLSYTKKTNAYSVDINPPLSASY